MRVVTAEQMRMIEEKAILEYGIPSLLLMENAALAVVREIRRKLESKNPGLKGRKAIVLAAKGNNGGDGLAVARHLTMLGMDVTVFLFASPERFQGDAGLNLRLYLGMGGKYFIIDGDKQLRLARLALNQAEVIVDALFGTGLRGALPSIVEAYVEEVNQTTALVVSVDIPSGVEASTGKVYRLAVKAGITVTFGLPKLGHFLGQGPEYTGRLFIDPISIPQKYLEAESISNFMLTDAILSSIPRRRWQGHKGTHGKGILVAGSAGMSGAAVLAGRSALRTGIGLLQIVTPRSVSAHVDAGVIEATVWPSEEETLGLNSITVIQERCQGAQAMAIGPGMGQNREFIPVLEEILSYCSLPLVLDADALNLLALEPEILLRPHGTGDLILTPHPGEMARLCCLSVAEVQENRLELAVSKAVEWEAIVVLKGAMTVIATPDGRAYINPTGNPGLGTGGTGDVLTGSILGWLAQGLNPVEAACLGVYLHGRAADMLAKDYGERGFTASQVADMLPQARLSLEKQEKRLFDE